MTNREQAIKQVAELVSASPESVQKALIGEVRFMQQTAQTLINYAIDATEKLLAAEARVLELTGGLDAAIEKARQDAHNEAVELVASFLEHKGQSEAAIIARMFTQGSITEADKAWADDRIRALAAQKKEG